MQWILDLNGHCKTKQVLFTMRVFLLGSQVCKSPTLAHTSATPEKTVWPETRLYFFDSTGSINTIANYYQYCKYWRLDNNYH